MIAVSLSTLLIMGMAAGLALLVGFWAVAVWRQRRHERKSSAGLIYCRICGGIYRNEDRKPVTACPSCGSLNESVRPRPI